MSGKRLVIYNNYSAFEIENAIDAWIHNEKKRRILKYKLINGYSYLKTADLVSKDMNEYISIDTVKRTVYEAENQLFKHLQIIRQ